MQDSENLQTTSRFRQLENIETENNPQVAQYKSPPNKVPNNSDSEVNHKQQNNSVELPWNPSKQEWTALIVYGPIARHHLPSKTLLKAKNKKRMKCIIILTIPGHKSFCRCLNPNLEWHPKAKSTSTLNSRKFTSKQLYTKQLISAYYISHYKFRSIKRHSTYKNIYLHLIAILTATISYGDVKPRTKKAEHRKTSSAITINVSLIQNHTLTDFLLPTQL